MRTVRRATPRLLLTLAAALTAAAPSAAGEREQFTTQLTDGNGSSRNAVISQDRRYAKVVAFESDASNLVPGDTNGQTDVFFITRVGGDNVGTPWRPGPLRLASRGLGGQPANGPSFAPAVDGGFKRRGGKPTHPRCVAFLSDASNLVAGDTNGQTDAFISHGPGGRVERVSVAGSDQQLPGDTTHVAVSPDCSHVAFVTDGGLHVRTEGRTARVAAPAPVTDPSFSSAFSDELVFAAGGSVYLMAQKVSRGERRGPLQRPVRIAAGEDPAFNDVKCRVIAYEKELGGFTQIAWRYLGDGEDGGNGATCHDLPGGKRAHERIASQRAGRLGNGDSFDPSVVNAGFYIGFGTHATNLQTKAGPTDKPAVAQDYNEAPDAYLFTAVRNLTLVMSQPGRPKGVPFDAGGGRPMPSWYANYVVFHSSGHDPDGPTQIYMRYLGAV